ncbi:F-box domain containing protein [Tanacetum coccineum]|uniref:F-box domain containing protein n=1 Tax=Tanacetum coccineum TaxID=301880 RepID=A0ABQ5AVQ0_9ASTR
MLPPTLPYASKSDGQQARKRKSAPKVKDPKTNQQKAKKQSAPKVKESTTNKQNAKKRKSAPKSKKSTRNWLDLPDDITGNILQRLSVIDRLENARKVCTTWSKICKQPSMWKVIHMQTCKNAYIPVGGSIYQKSTLRKLCKNAVDRSQGQLVDIKIVEFGDNELLKYIADSLHGEELYEYVNAVKYLKISRWLFHWLRLPTWKTELSSTIKAIETVGRHSPLLKILKVNQSTQHLDETVRNDLSIAIGKNLHELRHLELIGNSMTNIGLEAILDGCRHLELLDLRMCEYVDVNTDLGKRCSRQIQYLKLPNDSLNGCSYIYETENDYDDFGVDYPDGPYDYCPDDYEDLESFLRRTQPKSKSDRDNEWMIMDYYSLL